MTKRYNQQNFHIEMSNGETYSFYCYTTNTRNGFCHTCYCSNNGKNSKVSYYNRTWESYDYQSVLYNAFEKLPKDVREICKAWDKVKVKEGQEKADAFVKNFEKLYKATSPEFKERMKDVTITNKSDAKLMMSLAAIDGIFNNKK